MSHSCGKGARKASKEHVYPVCNGIVAPGSIVYSGDKGFLRVVTKTESDQLFMYPARCALGFIEALKKQQPRADDLKFVERIDQAAIEERCLKRMKTFAYAYCPGLKPDELEKYQKVEKLYRGQVEWVPGSKDFRLFGVRICHPYCASNLKVENASAPNVESVLQTLRRIFGDTA